LTATSENRKKTGQPVLPVTVAGHGHCPINIHPGIKHARMPAGFSGNLFSNFYKAITADPTKPKRITREGHL